jgi:murein DD-endopeptidase MepM/ murein hydrolase activator NlpD
VTVRALIAAGLFITLVPAIALSAPAASRTPPTKPAKPLPVTQKPAPEPAPVEKAAIVAPSATLVHEVQRGETLGGIARKYRVTMSSLVIANRLRGPRARLQPGQPLRIPRRGATPVLGARRAPVVEPLPVSLVLSVPDFEDPPSFQWPIVGAVTSPFGRRSRSWHRGIDIAADPGAPIVAAAAGVVIASGVEPRYGQMVKIEHDSGFVTVYAHNERNLVEVGQEVAAGQTIALAGRTGRATAEHVHFEIRHEGRVYNPLYLLPLPQRFVRVEPVSVEPHDGDD